MGGSTVGPIGARPARLLRFRLCADGTPNDGPPRWLTRLKTLPAVTTLRTIWEQQFEPLEQCGQWRVEPALPAAQLINSPYYLDARYGKKRTTLWVGYKVHFCETCDEDAPQLITHVETTRAGINDETPTLMMGDTY